jgi:release factor glutamine methyltransferase
VTWLLSRLLDVRTPELYLYEGPIPSDVTRRFWGALEDRAAGIPLQYLIGETEFYGRRFAVAPGVFIPRPETETIVEAAVSALRTTAIAMARPLRLLDLGTGSGCIAIALARRLPSCVLVGVELSWTALCVAHVTVRREGLSQRIHLVQGRWAEAVRGPFDGIISNPPYVPSAQVDHLPLDVRQEPRLSLDGGSDGMRELSQVVAHAPRVLAPGGVLVLECGEPHVRRLLSMVHQASWAASVEPLQDLAGRPRGILVIRAGERADG